MNNPTYFENYAPPLASNRGSSLNFGASAPLLDSERNRTINNAQPNTNGILQIDNARGSFDSYRMPQAQPTQWQPAQPNQGLISGFGQNQYTQRLADQLTARSNQNLNQTVIPQINQGAQLAGQYGGTRQGVAQGVAAGNAQTGLDSAIAGLYVDAYGRDQNFYTQQRGQDQSGMQLGANIYNMGNAGNLGIGAGQAALGQQYQNAPMQATQTYASTINPYMNVNGGTNSSHSSTTNNYDANGNLIGGGGGGGGGFNLQGALGGGLAGYQTAQNLGMGSGGNNGSYTTGGTTYTNSGGYTDLQF